MNGVGPCGIARRRYISSDAQPRACRMSRFVGLRQHSLGYRRTLARGDRMPRPIPPPLAVTLSALRAAYGWPQIELARAAGANKNDLSEMERGKKHLAREKLEELVVPLGAQPGAVDLT